MVATVCSVLALVALLRAAPSDPLVARTCHHLWVSGYGEAVAYTTGTLMGCARYLITPMS